MMKGLHSRKRAGWDTQIVLEQPQGETYSNVLTGQSPDHTDTNALPLLPLERYFLYFV
jgi:hypothetical protein